ncbi:MAG: DUF2071 domain-containing protein [Elusimicrobia bacterium]|nr:DUF2071 domain-containing protein [Elusimicrobiota bacterium]
MSRPVFLSARWRHLALFNFEVDPAVLTAYLPAGTELDFFEGRTYVSLVGFLFQRTSLFGFLPALFHRDFEEVNLRFYVLRRTAAEVRRGVVFIKEAVPRPLLAWTARALYGENYVATAMGSRIEAGRSCGYTWGPLSMTVETDGRRLDLADDSHERWITEHHWGYTRLSGRETIEYEVKHPIWVLRRVTSHELRGDLAAFYGAGFAPAFARAPRSVCLADGSDVTVHWPSRL